MSGSVLYKFKSSTAQSAVHFEGPHIALAELRAAIVRDNHIVKGRDFFLLELSNAQTGEVYAENALVNRNTAVLVKRVPLQRREAIESKGGETDLEASEAAAVATGAGDGDAAAGGADDAAAGAAGADAPNACATAAAAAPAPPPPTFGGSYGTQLIDPLSQTVFVDAVITTCCGTSFSKEVSARTPTTAERERERDEREREEGERRVPFPACT